MYERKIEETATLAEKFACLEMQTDPTSDGAWITSGEMDRGELRKNPSVITPLKRRFKFDSRTPNLLRQMTFSKRQNVRGSAKLDLNPKLDFKHMQEIMSNSEDMLAIAVAEARLTPE
jgi:inhibitor of KinA sporulation pathway (predicted exonuclease)